MAIATVAKSVAGNSARHRYQFELKGRCIMSQNVSSLFSGAQAGGDIGSGAAAVLNISDLGEQIQAGLGVSIDDVASSEVTLVTLLVDDSGSIRMAGNSQTMRDGVNHIRDALMKSKQSDSVLISVRYLNGTVLVPYMSLENMPALDTSNYNPSGGTPLYDQSVVTCGQVIAKRQEFVGGGVACRAVTVVISDGADVHSQQHSAADVSKVVKDMLLTESHIVIGMGISDGQTDFRHVFSEMGILNEWILTPGNSETEIRRAFAVVSQSAVRASQSAKSFSQAAGFTN